MWQAIVIIFCIALNALIAATEFAFIAVSRPRLRKLASEGNKSAERILALRENPERTLSILQLGITFIVAVSAGVGGATFNNLFAKWFQQTLSLGPGISEFLSVLFFVVPYTYLNVVLSELMPKSLALRNPKWVIFHVDRGLVFFDKILSPVVSLLEKSTKFAVKVFFSWVKREEPEGGETVSVGKNLQRYMLNLSKIEGKKLPDIMIPWSETDCIFKSASIEEVKDFILKTGHTRIPVIDEEKKPIGILFSKEFMAFYEKNDPNWNALIRPIIEFREDDTLVHALRVMQSERSHLSIIFKGETPLGIVTIEDILEEVVGEIYDEDDINRQFE